MTNKEAQITINAIKFMLDHAQYSDDVEEALNMAINALTAQSETHACDLIDRRALMKEFSDFVRASNNSDFAPRPTWNDAVSLVKSMPPVQPSSSCNHENDYISRQAAIREYQEVCKGIKCGECPFLIKVNTEKGSHLITDCKLEAFLHDLPSVQPKRKTGKWILVKEYIKIAVYKCSECGRSVWDDKGYDVVKDYPYCHCGADMRGEQDE